MGVKNRLSPETQKMAEDVRRFMSKTPRSRRDVADYLKVSKAAARNLFENHPDIHPVLYPEKGVRREVLYIFGNPERFAEKTSPPPPDKPELTRFKSPWDVLKK